MSLKPFTQRNIEELLERVRGAETRKELGDLGCVKGSVELRAMTLDIRASKSFFGNIVWGVKLGVIFASLYSLYAAILFMVVGSAPFDKHQASVLTVIATYFAGGITAGAVVGALRPYTHARFAAILVGIFAAFFVFFGVAVAAEGLPWKWDTAVWARLLVIAVLLGSFGGNMIWKDPL